MDYFKDVPGIDNKIVEGFIVFANNTKEYLVKFDFEGKKQLAWSKDKKKAMSFPDKGSAEKAVEMTIGKKFGSIIKESVLIEQAKAKKIKLTFRVWPVGMKPRSYKDLNGMAKDFTEDQLKDAAISMVIGASIILTLPNHAVQRILDEIF